MSAKQALYRRIPSIEVLLQDESLQLAMGSLPRTLVVDNVRSAVEQVRQTLAARETDDLDEEAIRRQILAAVNRRLEADARPHYRRAINATGIILHTALGRAVLPARAMRQIQEELTGYSVLQAEIETGQRSKRDGRIERLLERLTGAEAATVVNNNAAATAIVLNTVARGKEVIVSRGQLVEIGGSFRLPEVMEASGVKLVEVGTTNKTHPRDYERAIGENTAALMRVHPSNYRISGFTFETPLEEMVRIAHARNLVVIDDVGAGSLIDFSRFGFEPEPTLPASVAAGADIITSSADKLIGGPQGGIILGRSALVQAVRKNPLARIVRVDKLTLAALEATLTLLLDESLALREIPTLRMLGRSLAEIASAAERIADSIGRQTSCPGVSILDGSSQMGSGSLPTQNLPTRLVAVRPDNISLDELALRLRRRRPSIFARIHQGQVVFDPRTLLEGEEDLLVTAIAECLAGNSASE